MAGLGRVARSILKMLAILVATPLVAAMVALIAYDVSAVQPHLPAIEALLAAADPQDADPPRQVRDYIDANSGSPDNYAVRLALQRFRPTSGQSEFLLHGTLWHLLLPFHLDDDQTYGLYATLAFNGTDHGLNRLAQREFGRPLDRLTPREAATVVAFTHAPQVYLGNRGWLEERATLLMERAASPAMQGGAIP